MHYVQRNETLSLPYPNDTLLCKFSEDENDVILVLSSKCTIPIFDGVNFVDHNCYENISFSIHYNGSTRMIYFSNWTATFHKTVIFFMCITMKYEHYSSSHEILIGK